MAYRTTSWKNTDIGKIPSDWECGELGKMGSFISGVGFAESEQGGKSGIPFYKVSDMNLPGNEVYMQVANNYVTQEQIDRLRYKTITNRAIIFAKVGAAIFLERKRIAKDFLIDNNMMAFVPNDDVAFLKIQLDKIKFSEYTKVGALPSYNASDLQKIKIVLPQASEQQKIAEVLTDLDDLIAELEKVRDKKQAIKIGAMQELLTPKKGWIKRKLEDVCDDIFAGGTPSTTKESFWKNGDIIWLPSGMIQDSVISIENATSRITQSGLVNSSAKLIKPGTTILAMTGATCGKVAYLPFEAAANQSVMAFETTKVSSKFLFYVFLNNKDYVLQFQAGGAQAGINKTSCKNFEFSFPAKKNEQTAIANVLSDMDNEISAINDKINKYKQIKAGVADELLSGRIRLIKPQE